MNLRSRTAFSVGLTVVLALAGCSYYQVTDPQSGKVYYTRDDVAWRYTWTGTVRFHDWMSDQDITLASSEIKKVTREQFETATGRVTNVR
jgi:hypothetical protein